MTYRPAPIIRHALGWSFVVANRTWPERGDRMLTYICPDGERRRYDLVLGGRMNADVLRQIELAKELGYRLVGCVRVAKIKRRET